MDDNETTQTWQDTADELMEGVRRMHDFISRYVYLRDEANSEYAEITKYLADVMVDMNHHISSQEFGCVREREIA